MHYKHINTLDRPDDQKKYHYVKMQLCNTKVKNILKQFSFIHWSKFNKVFINKQLPLDSFFGQRYQNMESDSSENIYFRNVVYSDVSVIYIGERLEVLKNIQIWRDGSIYQQFWNKDMVKGKGRLYHANADIYDGVQIVLGKWEDHKAKVQGVFINSDRTRYEGTWERLILLQLFGLILQNQRKCSLVENSFLFVPKEGQENGRVAIGKDRISLNQVEILLKENGLTQDPLFMNCRFPTLRQILKVYYTFVQEFSYQKGEIRTFRKQQVLIINYFILIILLHLFVKSMGGDQSKLDYNYGQIIERDNLCQKRLQYDISAKDVFLQSLTSIPILKSFEEVDKITFCGSPNEIKAFFSYNQFTLHQFVLTQEFTLKETQIVCTIKQILSNMNQNKFQIHPKEILLPEYIMLDPELFLQKSDIQRIRQGNIKHQDYYLAPEVLTGKCKSNIAAQIFSLGLVCLFIMTKLTPFDFSIYDTTSFQSANLQKYINKINTGIYSQLLKNVVIDMLKEDPKQRINEDQIISRLDEVLMFHSQKTLKFQESTILQADNSSKIKLDFNEELKQSQLSYNYKERPSENQKYDKEKKQSKHTANNSPQTNHKGQNKENIEVEFITKKEKRINNYSFSACSSRSHIRGMSIKPAKKHVYQDKHSSVKQRWK